MSREAAPTTTELGERTTTAAAGSAHPPRVRRQRASAARAVRRIAAEIRANPSWHNDSEESDSDFDGNVAEDDDPDGDFDDMSSSCGPDDEDSDEHLE